MHQYQKKPRRDHLEQTIVHEEWTCNIVKMTSQGLNQLLELSNGKQTLCCNDQFILVSDIVSVKLRVNIEHQDEIPFSIIYGLERNKMTLDLVKKIVEKYNLGDMIDFWELTEHTDFLKEEDNLTLLESTQPKFLNKFYDTTLEGAIFKYFNEIYALSKGYSMSLLTRLFMREPSEFRVCMEVVKKDPFLFGYECLLPTKTLDPLLPLSANEINDIVFPEGNFNNGLELLKFYNKCVLKAVEDNHSTCLTRSDICDNPGYRMGYIDKMIEMGSLIEVSDGLLTPIKYYRLEEHLTTLLGKLFMRTPYDHTRYLEKVLFPDQEAILLNQEQMNALEMIQMNPIVMISGPGGSGKTTILNIYERSLREAGYELLGSAPTNCAVDVLKKSGLKAYTMDKIIAKKNELTDILNASALVIDESSMISLQHIVNFMQVVVDHFPNVKQIVFVGDVCQLPSIKAGNVFEDFCAVFPTAHLTKTHRIYDNESLLFKQVNNIRMKNFLSFTESHINNDDSFAIIEATDDIAIDLKKALSMLSVSQWESHIISNTNKHEKLINEIAGSHYNHKSMKDSIDYFIGEKMLCMANLPGLQMFNGTFFEILSIKLGSPLDKEKSKYVAVTQIRRDMNNNQQYLINVRKITALEAENPSINTEAVEDEKEGVMCIDTTINHKKRRALSDINGVPSLKRLRLDECPEIVYNKTNAKDITMGYFSTVHKMQGKQTDELIFIMDGYSTDQKLLYTAVSRARKKLIIICTHKQLNRAISNNQVRKSNLASMLKRDFYE